MGTTKIWWTKDGAPKMSSVDFGRILRDRKGPQIVYRQTVQESLSGIAATTMYGGRCRIRLMDTWTRDGAGTGDRRRRDLVDLTAHLLRGGICMVVEDSTYAFAAFAERTVNSLDQVLETGPNLFENVATADVNGRELWIHDEFERYRVEHKVCSAFSSTSRPGNSVTVTPRIGTDYSVSRWVMVREYGTYPAMRLPIEVRENGEFVLHEHEWIFTLDLPLEEDPQTYESAFLYGGPVVAETQIPGPLLSEWANIDDPASFGIVSAPPPWLGW